MTLPLTIGKTSSNEPFIVDLEQLPHLFVSYNDEAQIHTFFNLLVNRLSSVEQAPVSFAIGSSKEYQFIPSQRASNPFFKYDYKSAERDSQLGTKERFMSCLSREMRLRSLFLKKGEKQQLRLDKSFPSMVILLHDVFDIIISRKKSIGLIFLKLLLMGRQLKMHVVAASGGTYRNLLKQLATANPIIMERFKGKLGLQSFQIATSLGAEMVITAEDFVFFKEANNAEYQRFYPLPEKVADIPDLEFV